MRNALLKVPLRRSFNDFRGDYFDWLNITTENKHRRPLNINICIYLDTTMIWVFVSDVFLCYWYCIFYVNVFITTSFDDFEILLKLLHFFFNTLRNGRVVSRQS